MQAVDDMEAALQIDVVNGMHVELCRSATAVENDSICLKLRIHLEDYLTTVPKVP